MFLPIGTSPWYCRDPTVTPSLLHRYPIGTLPLHPPKDKNSGNDRVKVGNYGSRSGHGWVTVGIPLPPKKLITLDKVYESLVLNQNVLCTLSNYLHLHRRKPDALSPDCSVKIKMYASGMHSSSRRSKFFQVQLIAQNRRSRPSGRRITFAIRPPSRDDGKGESEKLD